MAKIGKDSYFIRLISKKTKIKPQDIFDVLMAFSECAVAAFFEEGPEEKQPVNFGAFSMYWRNTNLGPGIVLEPTKAFIRHTTQAKFEGKTDLAIKLYEMMLQKNKQEVSKRLTSTLQNIGDEKPKKQYRSVDYAIKAKENRIKLKEKRKKQTILLKAID